MIKFKSTKTLINMLEELCSMTANVTANDLDKHFKNIDDVKKELFSRIGE